MQIVLTLDIRDLHFSWTTIQPSEDDHHVDPHETEERIQRKKAKETNFYEKCVPTKTWSKRFIYDDITN